MDGSWSWDINMTSTSLTLPPPFFFLLPWNNPFTYGGCQKKTLPHFAPTYLNHFQVLIHISWKCCIGCPFQVALKALCGNMILCHMVKSTYQNLLAQGHLRLPYNFWLIIPTMQFWHLTSFMGVEYVIGTLFNQLPRNNWKNKSNGRLGSLAQKHAGRSIFNVFLSKTTSRLRIKGTIYIIYIIYIICMFV